MNITDIIERLKDEYGMSGEEINSGLCEDFALDVIREMGGYSEDITDMSPPFDSNCPGHIFVKYKNRYYDATHPKGVSNWRQLFKN
jgi:hypothetical protein